MSVRCSSLPQVLEDSNHSIRIGDDGQLSELAFTTFAPERINPINQPQGTGPSPAAQAKQMFRHFMDTRVFPCLQAVELMDEGMSCSVVANGMLSSMRNQLGQGFQHFDRIVKGDEVLLFYAMHFGSVVKHHTLLGVV